MARYISLPISVDPAEITQQAYEYLQSLIPGWVPADGNLDAWLLQTTARLAADLREIARDVPEEIFRYFGEEVLLVQPKLSSYASFESTWTAVDTDGYLIPAGTTIGVRLPTGDLAPFVVIQDYSIPAGLTTVTGVVAVADDPGSEASGLDTSSVVLIDSLPWVSTIVGAAPTSGGADGETTDEYMDRLVDEIRLMSPRPIVPQDFAVMAQRVAGVERGYPVNLYDADTDTPDTEKAITVVVTDGDGEVVSGTAKDEVLDLLESQREVNMLIFVRDPQYQDIDVAYTVMAMPDVNPVDLEPFIDAALEDYISPKHWGEVVQGTERIGIFRPENVVRYFEVAYVINGVDGVDYIEALTIGLGGGALGTADVTMDPGGGVPVVLPRIGDITGTVNQPT